MKKVLLLCAMVATLAVGKAESCWMMVTDGGVRVPMEQVGMLVAADDATTFSIVKTDGAGDAVSGVTSVSFIYDAGSSSIEDAVQSETSITLDAVSSSILVMGCAGRDFGVYDMSGAVRLGGNIGSTSERIDVSELAAGVYVLRVGGSSIKFIKK